MSEFVNPEEIKRAEGLVANAMALRDNEALYHAYQVLLKAAEAGEGLDHGYVQAQCHRESVRTAVELGSTFAGYAGASRDRAVEFLKGRGRYMSAFIREGIEQQIARVLS